MSCQICFEDWVCKCIPYDNFIVLVTQNISGTVYYAVEDAKGNIFSKAVDAELDGSVYIPLADFPEGLFTEFSGDLKIRLYQGVDLCVPIPMYIGKYYDCVTMSVRPGNVEKNTIGCPPTTIGE